MSTLKANLGGDRFDTLVKSKMCIFLYDDESGKLYSAYKGKGWVSNDEVMVDWAKFLMDNLANKENLALSKTEDLARSIDQISKLKDSTWTLFSSIQTAALSDSKNQQMIRGSENFKMDINKKFDEVITGLEKTLLTYFSKTKSENGV